jgi:hypothetical protein
LREEFKLFQNKKLRKVFGPKKSEETEKFRISHNGKLRDLGRLRGAGHVAGMGETRNSCGMLVGKPFGKISTWLTLKDTGNTLRISGLFLER